MRQIKSLLMLLFVGCLLAQPLTAQVRYLDQVFDDITVTPDVTYATNISILTGAPAPLDLKMDVYAPAGDDATDRPVVAYFHTGSFLPQYVNGQVTGGRQDSTVVEICTRLAKLGYVAVAATYRQGWLPLSEDQNVRTSTLLQAAYRGIHDARALIRYLRKTVAEDGNPLGIDDDKIVLWGQGTGGYLSLGCAFLDDYSEIVIEKFIDTETALPYVIPARDGDIYGITETPLNIPNYPTYSSDFAMAVNMGGALGDIDWIDGHENEPPTIGFHVLTDPFAPYGDGSVIVPTTDEFVVSVSGTGRAVAKANELGTNDVLEPALDPTDPLNAYVNALKGLTVDLSGFGHSAQTQVGVDHVYPFLTPGNQPGSGPWDWWDKATLDFYIPLFNAATGREENADELHSDGLLTNPDMSAEKARAYIDTIMAYYIPRAVIALDLMQTTVWDVIVNSEDHTTLETAISAAGLDETLGGEGPFTVFAPTDDAFGALPAEVINELLMTPEGELTQILLYHVLSGDVRSTDLMNGMTAMTVNGKDITVTINDDGVFINDAKVIVADLEADNGVVHVIDAVLLPPKQQIDLPITFDDADVDYNLVDFGGNASAIVVDPTDETNMVGQAVKTAGAESWAGTTMGENGLANAIPFSAAQTQMTVRVWSPDAGTPIRLKAEDAANAAISVETEAVTTVAMDWDTLTFNFNNQVAGTAPINLANTYDKLSIFFNFGTTGAEAGEQTYYWDDVEFTPLPDSTVFDIIVASPDHETLETAIIAAELDDEASGFGPFTVFAPTDAAFAALPDGALDALLGDPTGALAEVLLYHVLGAEVLSTDLSDGQMAATLQGADITVTINEDGVFINNAKVTVADLRADNGVVHVIDAVLRLPAQIDLPITFDDENVFYDLVDFGGNVSDIVVDPTDDTNMVGQATKTAGAESWAGTTMGGNGLANPIPFSASQTQMTVRVWSPDAGTPIRLKAEDAANGAISVETEAVSTVAADWETLTFNFNNEAMGTAPINFANTYDKLSIFFNFGTTGADAGEKTYYWDDVAMAAGPDSTVVDIIVASPDHGILETAVIAAGLDDDLSGTGPFTVFAPTDAAFAALPAGALDALLADPTGALAQVLLYHVLGAEVLSTDLTDGQMAATLQGADITVTINDDGVFINNAKVTVADLRADNGVVHVIDAVLLPPAQVDLPITFDDADIDYDLVDFGGNASAVEVDPTDATNMVGRATKTAGAESWAGTTMGDNGLANAVPFSAAQTRMTVRVWSPDAGTPVRLKVEDATNAGISVETEAMTTVAMDWDTLTFDFNNEAMGTAALNLANTYDKISIFFNFGTTGADAGEKTYYWDDVAMAAGPDSTVVDIIVASPDHGILETAVIAAGLDDDLSGAGPFTVFAPTDAAFAALPDGALDALLADPTGALAQVLLYHVLGAEVLSTDLTDGQMAATLQGADITVTINDDGVFINNAKVTVADLRADNGVVHVIDAVLLPPAQVDLPITFDDENVDYDLVDFGGNVSAIVVDPTDDTNMVGQATKTAGAESWAGTTMGENGLANAVPFSETATSMTVRVWSPDADTPIRLKVEDATNAGISVETEAMTTVAMDWETLTFDFSNQAEGTAELNLANTYDKISIFFNFGTSGADAGEKTYYWDDVLFGTTNLAILPAAQNGIKVFPNPANTQVNVEFTKVLNEVVQMRLIDLSGRVLKQIETNDQISQINTNDLIPGAYFLRIDSKSASYYQKIMIAR